MNREVIKTAVKIALKSREDDLFLIAGGDAVKLEPAYDGWLLQKPLRDIDAGLGIWCFMTQRIDANSEVVEKMKGVKEKVTRVANLFGIKSEPLIELVEKQFKIVKVVRVRGAEKYVYDFQPTGEEAVAVLAYVHYVWRGRRNVLGFSKLLKAEFASEDVEVDEAGVYVPRNIEQLSDAIAELMRREGAERGGRRVKTDL